MGDKYKKIVESIAKVISPTDYKIIELISSVDDELTKFINKDMLPTLNVALEIQNSTNDGLMSSINNFVVQLINDFDEDLFDIDLEAISTDRNTTSIKFKALYKSIYEKITSEIVEYSERYFRDERALIIVNNIKKDKILEMKLIEY
tara:strand:- start:45 stop:485 length:441 start_codon:yes stop_codon:yes gene_type:complete